MRICSALYGSVHYLQFQELRHRTLLIFKGYNWSGLLSYVSIYHSKEDKVVTFADNEVG